MPGEEPVRVHHDAVEEAVGILSFLGDEGEPLFEFRFPLPGGGTEREFPSLVGGQFLIGGVVQAQFPAGLRVFGRAAGVRQVPGRVRLQGADRFDRIQQEGLQALLFQPVGGEAPEPAVHEQGHLQAPVQGVGDLVQFAVQHPEQLHQALVERHARFLRAVGEREFHRGPREGDFLVCQHLILLLRSGS